MIPGDSLYPLVELGLFKMSGFRWGGGYVTQQKGLTLFVIWVKSALSITTSTTKPFQLLTQPLVVTSCHLEVKEGFMSVSAPLRVLEIWSRMMWLAGPQLLSGHCFPTCDWAPWWPPCAWLLDAIISALFISVCHVRRTLWTDCQGGSWKPFLMNWLETQESAQDLVQCALCSYTKFLTCWTSGSVEGEHRL
jgi:hypothetical protein